ncbi:unnamed protein product, partial [Prunus brigantina]
DPLVCTLRLEVENGDRTDYSVRNDGALMVGTRLYVPNDQALKREILEEAHSSAFAMHPGSTKMYYTLKEHYWWPFMKKEIAEYNKHDGVWVIVDRLTKSAHFLPVRANYTLNKLAKIFMDEIVRLHGVPVTIVSDRDPRFTSRFWAKLHDVFHVSMLRKYIPDPSHVLEEQPIELAENLTYVEQPVQILDWKTQVLRTREIPLVKVLWRSHNVEEATWEPEDQMREQYPSPLRVTGT